MRWILAVSLLLCAACPDLPDGPRYLGADAETPRRGGTLMLWEEARVRMLDPHIAFDQISGVLVDMLYDSLYRYDHELNLVPAVAEALPEVSEDGRTLIIPIRRGVRFHNGRVLDARDVLWSLERMLGPDLHSPGAPYFTAIEGYEDYQAKKDPHLRGLSTPDAYTLRITLKQPDQSFVFALAMRFASPMPREELAKPDANPKRSPCGTGAFKLVSWDPGVRLVLARNPLYYRPNKPQLDRVVFEEGLQRDTAIMRFRNGEVDIAPRMSPADAVFMLGGKWKPYTAISPRADTYGLAMNTGMAPFDNVHVRRAVAFAIDRERWSRARNGFIRPTGQIVPPKVAGYDAALPHVQHFDLGKARAEMKLAGFANGLPTPVAMWINDGAAARAYFELAQADLAKIGIQLEAKVVSFPVYLEETGKPRTAQMASVGWSLDFPDASNILHLVSKGAIADSDSMNRSFFQDARIEELLARGIVERDKDKRRALYREANDRVAELAPWAFFCNTAAAQAWQPYVRGYKPHPINWVDISDTWLDLPRKRIAALLREPAQQIARLFP
ncbi:MAG TPA: ABC transporter substrate-binding protein [Polyangiales bacterium]|nr:ABC transporter substrate-binding protein [Polyangiales bacterium]